MLPETPTREYPASTDGIRACTGEKERIEMRVSRQEKLWRISFTQGPATPFPDSGASCEAGNERAWEGEESGKRAPNAPGTQERIILEESYLVKNGIAS